MQGRYDGREIRALRRCIVSLQLHGDWLSPQVFAGFQPMKYGLPGDLQLHPPQQPLKWRDAATHYTLLLSNHQAAQLAMPTSPCPKFVNGKIDYGVITFDASNLLGCGVYGRTFRAIQDLGGAQTVCVVKFCSKQIEC